MGRKPLLIACAGALLLLGLAVAGYSFVSKRMRGGTDLLAWVMDNPHPAEIEREEQLIASLPGIEQYSLRVARDGEQYWAFYVKADGWLYGAPFSLEGNKLAGAWVEERIAPGQGGYHNTYNFVDFAAGQPVVSYREKSSKHCYLAQRHAVSGSPAGTSWHTIPLPQIRRLQGLAVSEKGGYLYLAYRASESKLLSLASLPLDGLADSTRWVDGTVLTEDCRESGLIMMPDGQLILACALNSGGIQILQARTPAPTGPDDWRGEAKVDEWRRSSGLVCAVIGGQPAVAYSAGERGDIYYASRIDQPPRGRHGEREWASQRIYIPRLGGKVGSLVDLNGRPGLHFNDMNDILLLALEPGPQKLSDWCCTAARDGTLFLPSCQLLSEWSTLRAFWVREQQELSLISYPAMPRPRVHSRSAPDRLDDLQELLNGEELDRALLNLERKRERESVGEKEVE